MIDGFHRPEHQFLSNFYELRPEFWIPIKNPATGSRLLMPTGEHAYQACKFVDDKDRALIYHCKFAGMAKKKAAELKDRVRPDWKEISLQVMNRVVRYKAKDPLITDMLLATGDELIQESNWWGDDFYGVVTKKSGKPCVPYGANHLGRIWMEVREEKRGFTSSNLSS